MQKNQERLDNPFYLTLAQQHKCAQDLLTSFRKKDSAAIKRVKKQYPEYSPELSITHATAQYIIAREFGFSNWLALKHHIEALSNAEQDIQSKKQIENEAHSLHIRCGSDIQQTLSRAGMTGDFLEYSDPLCQGPVTEVADWLSQRADFIFKHYCHPPSLSSKTTSASIFQKLALAEQKLQQSAQTHARITLWFEHDSYDLFILCRILDHFYHTFMPEDLGLIQINHFPGTTRFRGLGQLPPAAIRHIWSLRRPVTSDLLHLGYQVWQAFRQPTPLPLWSLRQTARDILPDLSAAITRHLAELPDFQTGLSLTQSLILTNCLDAPATAGQIFRNLCLKDDPLPFLGDVMYFDIIREMLSLPSPVLHVISNQEDNAWPHWQLSLTDLGKRVLAGQIHYLSLIPPSRWLGGVFISPDTTGKWCWDCLQKQPILKP